MATWRAGYVLYRALVLVSDTYVLDDWYRVLLFLSVIILYQVYSWTICRGLHWKIQTDTAQLMGSMDNSDHVYLHQCNMLEYYDIAQRIQFLLFLTLIIFFMLGLSSFQVVSIQFGTDQLQGAPSDHFSAFVFWYFMIELLLGALIQVFYLLSLFENKNITERIPLALSLLSALLISIALSIKSCFMHVRVVLK